MKNIKKCAVLILIIMNIVGAIYLLSGCGMQNKISMIPEVECEKFRWNRTGNVTSASVSADDIVIEGEYIKIGLLEIHENWGPFFSGTLMMEGYKRKRKGFIPVDYADVIKNYERSIE